MTDYKSVTRLFLTIYVGSVSLVLAIALFKIMIGAAQILLNSTIGALVLLAIVSWTVVSLVKAFTR